MSDEPTAAGEIPAQESSEPAGSSAATEGPETGFMGPAMVVGREAKTVTMPRWVPFALLGTLVLGVIVGAGGALLLMDGDSSDPGAGQAAAAPNDGEVAPAPAGTVPTAGFDDPDAYGEVELTGAPLPRFEASGVDAAVGRMAPDLIGAGFAGEEISITNDGRAKIMLFVAHWCPYCQSEVPTVRDWVAATELPDNVDVYSVVTLTDPGRANYPPRPWLETEGWTVPVVVDDGLDTAANTFGLNAVPFWVFVNTDGTVAFRHAGGGVPAEALTEVATQLAAGPPEPIDGEGETSDGS
jgi:thiol-disulfide isomerase/thioredoxin